MRKVLSLVALLGLISTKLLAVYYPITQHANGNQAVGGNTVTVTRVSPPVATPQNFCGVGPYYPGGSGNPDGWDFAFATPVTHIRVTLAEIHSTDILQFSINGTPVVLTNANLSPYPGIGTCVPLATYTITGGGELTSTTGAGTGAGVIVTIENTPGVINSFRLFNSGANPDGAGALVEFQNDSCDQTLVVTQNEPCAGRELKLSATNFPGATFSWTGPQLWTANGPNVSRNPVLQNQGGWYAVTVNWGSCTFKDSTLVTVATKPTPILPNITVITGNNPTCKNMDLELEQASTGAGGIQYYWYSPNLPGVLNAQVLSLPNIQPNQAGVYYAYAISTSSNPGCVSDTAQYIVNMLPDVTAAMNVTWKYGCTQDTVIITNNSTGQNISNVFFNPVVNNIPGTNLIDASGNTVITHYKPHNVRDTIPDTVDIKLVVGNGVCQDSVTQRVVFNHPVFAKFAVSDDTVCQHTQITFNNLSSAAVGPTHTYLWDFKNGDTAQTYSAQYTYHVTGVYLATLTVTDYLGCKDSAKRYIFVDSTGAITFNVSDSVVCSGDKIDFSAIFERFGTRSILWEYGDGNSVADSPFSQHAYDISGEYTVRFTSFNRVCPDTFSERKMVVNPYPQVDLGPDTSICPNGEPVYITELVNGVNPLAKYRWHTGVLRDTTAKMTVRHPGTYAVSVEVDGCTTTDSVSVLKNCYVNIPNAFTPNGDGRDDYFLPRQFLSMGVKKFSMVIFNRWGQKVFETNSIDGRGWDGMFNNEAQPLGVYVYQLNVTFKNNVSENYTGNVTLLR